MLRLLIGIILVLWLIGFVAQWGGSLIHLLLLVAGVVFVLELMTGRRAAI
jgi:hypothetical protein